MNKKLTVTLSVDAKTGEVTAVRNSFDKLDRKVSETNKSLVTAKNLFLSLGGLVLAKQIASMADQYKLLEGRVSLVTDSSKELKTIQQAMLDIAQDTRVELLETTNLYTRLHIATKDLHIAGGDLLTVTTSINKSLIISGASAQEASASVRQLGQGFASGVLRGEELNSVMENSPRLSRAIADGMGVTIGQLRALGAEGKLTSKVVFDALMSQSSIIDTEFKKMPITIDQALTQVKNSILSLVGETDKVFGTSGGISGGIRDVAAMIKENIPAIVAFAGHLKTLAGTVVVGTLAWKAQSLAINPLISKYKAMSFSAEALTGHYIALRFGLKGILSTVKSFVGANLPFLAIVTAYEAWSFITGDVARKEEELTKILQTKGAALESLTKYQALDNLNKLQDALQSYREITHELQLQLKIAKGRNHIEDEETIAIRAKLDEHIQNTNEIKKQISTMSSLVDGTYQAEDALAASASTAGTLSDELYKASQDAYTLMSALGNSEVAMQTQLIRARKIAGDITESASIRLTAGLKSGNIQAQIEETNKLYSVKGANVDKLNLQIQKLYTTELTLANNTAESLKRIEERKRRESKITSKSRIDSATKALEAQKKLNREYMKLTGDKSGLFQVDVEETMQKFIDSGAYSAEQLSSIYDGMWNDYQDKAKESSFNVHTWLKDAFNIDSDSIFGKLFDDFSGLFDGLIGVIKSDKGINGALAELDLGVRGAEMLQKSGDPMLAGIGYGIEALGALFSNTLSEAEIKAASGRNTFDSESITKSISFLDGVVSEQTPIMQNSLRMLEALNDKFGSIAVAISSSSNGLDLDGSEYQNSQSAGFLGFSSSSSTLIGAGIKFGEQTIGSFVQGVDAVGYEAVKETSSSFWGLVQNESIKEIEKGLPESLKQDLALAFNDSVEAVMQAVDVLGFDTDAMQAKIDQYVLDLGKLNFNELDASEQAKALSDAFSEQLDGAFSDAINSLVDPQNAQALENMAKAGESYTETLVRAAVQLETVAPSLAYFGIAVDNFDVADKLVQAAGGLEKWGSAQSTFVNDFLSSEEQQAYLKTNLESTLALYDQSLPASKAQFVALKLETEAKMVNVQATISTLKAEIAAKVASGEMSIKAAYGELEAKATIAQSQQDVTKGQIYANNQLINSSHESGKAVVGFGNSLNSAIKGIATGTAQAVIDGSEVDASGIDFAAITSPAIQAAEAELANLEGLYGSLMNNMGAFSDYYGGVESAATSAADAMTELEKSLVSLANLKAVWGEDDVSAKKIILDATIRNTGLTDLTYENFLPRLTAETADGLGMTQDELQKWEDMSKALRDLHDALDRRTEEEKEAVRKDLNFYENILKQIEDTFTGSLSSLSSYEKADYAAQAAQRYQAEGDTQNYIRMIQTQVESERKISTTREEYERSLFAYREELRRQNPQDIEEQQLETLQDINDKLIDVEQAIEDSSIYQSSRSA